MKQRPEISHLAPLGNCKNSRGVRIPLLFLPSGTSDEPTCQCRRCKRHRFDLLSGEDPLEEGMATHSSILAWRILWTEEPGGLQSIGSQRVNTTEATWHARTRMEAS